MIAFDMRSVARANGTASRFDALPALHQAGRLWQPQESLPTAPHQSPSERATLVASSTDVAPTIRRAALPSSHARRKRSRILSDRMMSLTTSLSSLSRRARRPTHALVA